MSMLREQYKEEFKHHKLEKIRNYFDSMNEYERDVLILYSEYASYRKVADETYCSYKTIQLIMSCIKQDINKLIAG